MEFCRSVLGVLILLIISTGSESAVPVVKVEYKGAAVLPCTDTCTGVISWTLSHKSTDILAECDQTSCRSVKEGYQMNHDQYLQGNFSLIITGADYSKRGQYSCDCDGVDKCDAVLQIEALKTPVQIKPGDSLKMEVDVLDPVDVIYRRKREASNVTICTVEGGSLKPSGEYTNRTSLSSSTLELREVEKSDCGDYIIQDIQNNGDLRIYTVNVTDADAQKKMWLVFGIGSLIVAVVGVGFLLFKKKNMFWFKKSAKLANFTQSGDSCNEQNIYSPENLPLNHQQV